MKTDELIMALQKLKVQTGSLACIGCKHEDTCGMHGCALIREAVNQLIEQNGWINPKERLPERGVPVLTYNKWGARPCGNTADVGRAALFCGRAESWNRCAVLATAAAVAGGAMMYILSGDKKQIINSDFVERFCISEKSDAALIVASYDKNAKVVTVARYRDLREAQKVLGELLCAIAGGQAYYTMPESLLYAEQHISKDARTKRKGGS